MVGVGEREECGLCYLNSLDRFSNIKGVWLVFSITEECALCYLNSLDRFSNINGVWLVFSITMFYRNFCI